MTHLVDEQLCGLVPELRPALALRQQAVEQPHLGGVQVCVLSANTHTISHTTAAAGSSAANVCQNKPAGKRLATHQLQAGAGDGAGEEDGCQRL